MPSPKHKKPTVAKTAAVDETKVALTQEIEKLHDDLDVAANEINQLKAELSAALQQSQTSAAIVEELAHLKAVIAPFVKSAKGEHTTTPEDWERIKTVVI